MKAIDAGDGIERGRADLTEQAAASRRPRIAHEPGSAMEHLAEGDAAKCRIDEVVQRRVIGLAEIFPRAAAERRDPSRFPETQAVGAAGVVVVVALVGVADLVDEEIVQVPDPALLHVGPPGGRSDPCRDLPPGEVCQFVEDVDVGRLEEGLSDTPGRTPLTRAPLGDPGGLLDLRDEGIRHR